MTPGWSSYGGQTISPFVGPIEKHESMLGFSNPGGSSVGSVMGVAAGFAPFSIGTDTIGSLITPGCRGGVYALKPTVGRINMTGVFGLSPFFDAAGPIAKCAEDIRTLFELLLLASEVQVQKDECKTLTAGFVDPDLWTLSDDMCR